MSERTRHGLTKIGSSFAHPLHATLSHSEIGIDGSVVSHVGRGIAVFFR